MTVFYDDFERANGSPGANWTVNSGTGQITGGSITTGTSYRIVANSLQGTGRIECMAHVFRSTGSTYTCGPVVKCDLAGNGGFGLGIKGSAAPWTLCIIDGILLTGTVLASWEFPSTPAVYNELRIVWDNGHISGYCNGVLRVEVDSAAYSTNEYAGLSISNNSGTIADCRVIVGSEVAFSVSPSPIGNYGTSVQLTFTGTNTNWTPGTPGSPTFTVDHGSLSDQEVASTTSAQAIYDPGNFLGIATFTDPSTGATCAVTVTSNPNTVPFTGPVLSQTAIDYIERSAVAPTSAIIANREMVVTETGPGITLENALGRIYLGQYDRTYSQGEDPGLSKLLWLLYGVTTGYDPLAEVFDSPTTSTSIKVDTETAVSRLDLSQVGGSFNVGSLARALAGFPGGTIQDVLDGLSNVAFDDSDIIAAIEAARGEDLPSIRTAVDLIGDLATIAGYDLSDVLTAISNVRGSGNPDLAAVMAKLAQVQPSTSYTLSSLNTQGVDIKGLLDTLALVIGIVAPEAGTIADIVALIYDAVSALPTETPSTYQGPPVWIDEEHATIDSPIALSDGLLLEGPMDGVIVTITGARAGAGKFAFGDVTSWRYCGGVVFGTDRGDWEWAQPIGLESQIITCKTMQHASSALFRLESGFTGTAQPFTVTAGT